MGMPFCPGCGAEVGAEDSFCKRCGARLLAVGRPDTAPTVPAEERPTAVAPSRATFWTRPVSEGVAIALGLSLVFLGASVFLSKDYVPFGWFYTKPLGWVWVAIVAVGAAWSAKDAREQGFTLGGITGGIVGLLFSLIEYAVFGGGLASPRYSLGSTLFGVAVGLFAGLFAGILGSPVMVRFPTRQKRMAVGIMAAMTLAGVLLLSLPGGDAEDHFRLGLRFTSLGMYSTAAEEFQKSIRLNPYVPSPHNNLGICYLKMGLIEEAISEWKTAKFLDPMFPDPRENLAKVYETLRMREEMAMELGELAKLYLAMGKEEEALEAARKALDADPNNKDALYVLEKLTKGGGNSG